MAYLLANRYGIRKGFSPRAWYWKSSPRFLVVDGTRDLTGARTREPADSLWWFLGKEHGKRVKLVAVPYSSRHGCPSSRRIPVLLLQSHALFTPTLWPRHRSRVSPTSLVTLSLCHLVTLPSFPVFCLLLKPAPIAQFPPTNLPFDRLSQRRVIYKVTRVLQPHPLSRLKDTGTSLNLQPTAFPSLEPFSTSSFPLVTCLSLFPQFYRS